MDHEINSHPLASSDLKRRRPIKSHERGLEVIILPTKKYIEPAAQWQNKQVSRSQFIYDYF